MRLAIEILICIALVVGSVFLDRVEVHSQEELSAVSLGMPFAYVIQNQGAFTPPLPWTAAFLWNISNYPVSVRVAPLVVNFMLAYSFVRLFGRRVFPVAE